MSSVCSSIWMNNPFYFRSEGMYPKFNSCLTLFPEFSWRILWWTTSFHVNGMLDKNLKTARQITIHAKIAGPILKLSKIFLLHYLADSYYTEIKKESSIGRFMCAYSYEFFCLPVSFFSFKSTFSVSLVLPSLHLCKNHKTLDLIMILQHNLTSKMVTQLSNHYSTWCNGITRFKWSNQWEIQQKLSTDPIHGPPVWSKKADLLCISGMQRRLIRYGAIVRHRL